MQDIRSIPKAEQHVHIEGTVTPDKAREMAERHGMHLPDDIFTPDGQSYVHNSFYDIVGRIYDHVASTIRTPDDFELITYDYLSRCAAENTLYVEFIISPNHCDSVGLAYSEMVAGMATAINRAREDFGIEARMNATLVRNRPWDELKRDAQTIVDNPHPYVTGLDLAGLEEGGDIVKFMNLYQWIRENSPQPLGMRLHAGENAGAGNVRDALKLTPQRIGHGVRAAEDTDLMRELASNRTVLEVCPTSNVLAGVYSDFGRHPLRELADAGIWITLNSDDPGLFGTTIGREYEIARTYFGFGDTELVGATHTAIATAFMDAQSRYNMLQKLQNMAPKPGAGEAPGCHPR